MDKGIHCLVDQFWENIDSCHPDFEHHNFKIWIVKKDNNCIHIIGPKCYCSNWKIGTHVKIRTWACGPLYPNFLRNRRSCNFCPCTSRNSVHSIIVQALDFTAECCSLRVLECRFCPLLPRCLFRQYPGIYFFSVILYEGINKAFCFHTPTQLNCLHLLNIQGILKHNPVQSACCRFFINRKLNQSLCLESVWEFNTVCSVFIYLQ